MDRGMILPSNVERPDKRNKKKKHGALDKGGESKAIIKLNEEENESSTPLW